LKNTTTVDQRWCTPCIFYKHFHFFEKSRCLCKPISASKPLFVRFMEPRNRFQPQAYVACCAGTTILFDVRCNRFLVSINVYNSGSGKFDCFLWFVFLSFLSCLTENVAQWRKKFSLRIYDSEVLFLDRISTFYEAFISPFKRRYCISEILHFLDGNLAKKIGWNKSRTPEIATICQADSK
jgi:hypothetical protein